MLRFLRTISASSTALRNDAGSSNAARRSAALPMPAGTWASDPAPRRSPCSCAKRSAERLSRSSQSRAFDGLEEVDLAHVLPQERLGGRRVEMVEGVRHRDETALGVDQVERLGERQAARHLLVQEEPDHLAVARGLDLGADDDVQRQAALDGARTRFDATRDRVVIGDRERAEAGGERRVEQFVDRRRAIPRVPAVHVQVGQHAARSRTHARTRR